MQIIAPDFYAPFGGKSSAPSEERPGDRLFDTLLRDEERRYGPKARPEREDFDASRPPRESNWRDEEHRSERAERTGDEREPRHRADATDDDRRPQRSDDERPAASAAESDMTDDAAVSGDHDATAAPATKEAASQSSETAAAQAMTNQPTVATPAIAEAAKTTGTATLQASQDGKAESQAAAPAKAAAIAATAAASPAASATEAGSKPASTGAATPQTANSTATPVADGKTAAAIPTVETQAAAAPLHKDNRPAGRNVGASRSVEDGQTGLSSRPSATLGGGAATAAMSQAGATTTAAKPATGEQAAKADAGLVDQNRPGTIKQNTSQAAAGARSADVGLAPGAEKPGAAGLASTPSGVSEAGSNAPGQLASGTPLVAGQSAGTGSVQHSSLAETLNNARHSAPADPAEQIALQVRRAQVAGQERINIKLHPAELGRIEVKLESGTDGTLRAVISAERADTLDLLQRDSRGLERALQEAGVKTDSGSLNFNLRGQGQGNERQAEGDGAPGRGTRDGEHLAGDAGEAALAAQQQARSSHDGALDIRV